MTEPRRKQLRSFFCDEQVWAAYERLAKEQGVTIDQLIGQALASALTSPDLVATAPPVSLVSPAAPAVQATVPIVAAAIPEPPAEPSMPKLWVILDGKRYAVNKPQFVIGRGANETDLLIVDTNVSRRHAQVVLHQGYFFIQDLGSTNGTTVNNAPVQEWQLADGDVIRVGHSEIIVRLH